MSLTGDPLTDRMVAVASRLVGAVREFDNEEVAAALDEATAIDEQGLVALAVTLAAMVPYDVTPGALLRWVAYRKEYERLVAIGVDPAAAATIINNACGGANDGPH